MRGTKLWQEPRSPLISGRSRRDRPFTRDWLMGSLIAGIIAAGLLVFWLLPRGLTDPGQIAALAFAGAIGCFVGCAPLVWVARRFGLRPPWVAGGLGGTLGAVATVVAYASWSVYAVGK